jgi:5-methylcytosine-specific restriction endonuclease McrA
VPTQRVFALEKIVDQLYEDFYPYLAPPERKDGFRRGFRLFISEAMGCLVAQEQDRSLIEDRSYYRIDLDDFMEFATTELAPEPVISQFPEGTATFFEFTQDGVQGCLEGEFVGIPVTVCPVDAVIARCYPFVSATVRFVYLREIEGKKKIVSIENDPLHHYVTLVLAARDGNTSDERSPLEEWDRYSFSPPYEDDPQWRFDIIEGVYTDAIISEIEKDKATPPEITRRVTKIQKSREKAQPVTQLQFEIARLMLNLPSYVAFMYDLVTEERRQLKQSPANRLVKRRSLHRGPTYRIIRSIRIIRPREESASIPWRAPARLHAVRGHWRMLLKDSVGKSPEGARVPGKTWVREHTRGQFRELATDAELKVSNVVINIKQTLQYARDVIQAASGAADVSAPRPEDLKQGKPSAEWIAEERAKLSAGLRFIILKRDGFRCQQCGASAVEDNFIKLEVDHKVPVSAWGRTEESNLWTLCVPCNKGKSDRQ